MTRFTEWFHYLEQSKPRAAPPSMPCRLSVRTGTRAIQRSVAGEFRADTDSQIYIPEYKIYQLETCKLQSGLHLEK
jgi:hypothetical protein